MSFERRDFDDIPELRMEGDATRLVGYAAVFNRLSHDVGGFVEKIAPGAFKRVLNRGDNILALFNHDMDNLLGTRAAGNLRMEEDSVGLRYELDLDPTDPDHQRVMAKVRRKDLRGSSFSFRTSPKGDRWSATDKGYPLREVTDIAALRDVGPVTSPAYPDTGAGAKALALRSLADLVDTPVEDLIAATDLKAFLDRMAEESETPSDIVDAASVDNDAASDERWIPPNVDEWLAASKPPQRHAQLKRNVR